MIVYQLLAIQITASGARKKGNETRCIYHLRNACVSFSEDFQVSLQTRFPSYDSITTTIPHSVQACKAHIINTDLRVQGEDLLFLRIPILYKSSTHTQHFCREGQHMTRISVC